MNNTFDTQKVMEILEASNVDMNQLKDKLRTVSNQRSGSIYKIDPNLNKEERIKKTNELWYKTKKMAERILDIRNDDESRRGIIAEFLVFYKENFTNPDFTLKSLTRAGKGDRKQLMEDMLYVVKQYLSPLFDQALSIPKALTDDVETKKNS